MTKNIPIVPEERNPQCEKCELYKSSKHVCIAGIGPKDAEIFIIGEAPGSAEARFGKPFQGPAGQLLRECLTKVGIDPEKCFITNMVGCRPPENRTPTNPELKACRGYLEHELRTVNPRFVLLLGATALKFIGRKGITDLQGTVQEPGDGRLYFPLLHPAAILRFPDKLDGFTDYLAKFKKLTEGTLVEVGKTPFKFVTPLNEDLFISKFRESPEFSFDIETTGLQQHAEDFRVNSIGYTLSDDATWVLPLALNKNPTWAKTVFRHTTRLAEGKIAIAHNGKFDDNGIWHDFDAKFRLTFDTMLASHVFDENSSHELKYLARVHCGAPEWDDLLLREKIDPVKYNCLDKFYQYQAEDPYWTMQLYRFYRDKFKGTVKLRRLFNKLVMPAARIFEEIDYGGLFIRLKEFEETRIELKRKIAQNEVELLQMMRQAGVRRIVNWGSPKQVAEILYEKLKLPVTEKTDKGAPSTGESALLQIQGMHPISDKLIEWRGNNKQLNTYIEGWEELMEGPMLYLSTKLHGTVTGRYSSRLHQTPRDGTIRNLVDAPPPYTFVVADYSQIELRLVAHAAQEPTMMKIFQEGGDIHIATAQDVMMTDEEPTKEQRKAAKGVNFGYVYGMWWVKFKKYAKEKYGVDLTDQQAKSFREAYFAKYCALPHWHDHVRDIVREQGYIEYLSGRIRRLPGVYSSNKEVRQEAERQAINSPIQGFGSGDLKVMAMIEIYETFCQNVKDPPLLLKGEVHDSILMWIKTDRLFEIMPKVKAIMENPKLFETFHIKLDVPLIADIEYGTWGLGTKFKS